MAHTPRQPSKTKNLIGGVSRYPKKALEVKARNLGEINRKRCERQTSHISEP
jgi:hypothetical protein